LRKGLHYLAEAASLARGEIANLDVHVAGVAANDVDWIEHKSELNCLGTIPMGQMHKEFSQADVLVLPSLSEGQAGVVLEAMACGCPVIATRESGIDFKPGCGITVPARNAGALAEAICDVVGDREKRQRLAEGALRQSADYTMDAWKQRLVNAVEEVESI
jgi:glycosyltransferase involved in cell wall biosynthesis